MFEFGGLLTGCIRKISVITKNFPEISPLYKSFPKIGTIGAYAVCRAAAAGRR